MWCGMVVVGSRQREQADMNKAAIGDERRREETRGEERRGRLIIHTQRRSQKHYKITATAFKRGYRYLVGKTGKCYQKKKEKKKKKRDEMERGRHITTWFVMARKDESFLLVLHN